THHPVTRHGSHNDQPSDPRVANSAPPVFHRYEPCPRTHGAPGLTMTRYWDAPDSPARMTTMLITEELFLLLRRDDGKPESAFAQNGYGLAGAVISDLVITEQVTVSDDKDPRLTVLTEAHANHPVLTAALQRL